MKYNTIAITDDTKEFLTGMKLVPNETYNNVIKRMKEKLESNAAKLKFQTPTVQ